MLAKGREPPKLTDLDGDGLVDHVLRIPGAATYWKRNISGKYGQLTQVNLPQGGNVEIDYAEQFGTPDNPNFKYVMSRVTMNDGTDKDDVLPELKHCNTRYGTNYTADDLQGLNSDTISDKNKIYAGNHLNLGKAEDVQKRAADYTSRATTQDLIEQVTPERKEDHHLRNGLLEIGAGLTIWVLTGIEVRNAMLKDPKSTTQVGYGGILAGRSLIADGFVRATGNSKTTVKEDFMSLLESPLGNAVREFNNSNTNGNGRKPGRTVDFSNKKSAKKEGEN